MSKTTLTESQRYANGLRADARLRRVLRDRNEVAILRAAAKDAGSTVSLLSRLLFSLTKGNR